MSVSDFEILVGKHIQTRITSKPTFLFMEHSISWSVILIFLWENIFKQETLQNPQFLFMKHSKSWSVILQLLWENIFKQETLQTPRFYSWNILKIGQ